MCLLARRSLYSSVKFVLNSPPHRAALYSSNAIFCRYFASLRIAYFPPLLFSFSAPEWHQPTFFPPIYTPPYLVSKYCYCVLDVVTFLMLFCDVTCVVAWLQSLRILKNSDLMPYVVFVAPPSLVQLKRWKVNNSGRRPARPVKWKKSTA